MKKNTLVNLHDILMERIETLADSDLKGEDLAEEITRCKAITGVADTMIENAGTMLKARDQAHRFGVLGPRDPALPLIPGETVDGS